MPLLIFAIEVDQTSCFRFLWYYRDRFLCIVLQHKEAGVITACIASNRTCINVSDQVDALFIDGFRVGSESVNLDIFAAVGLFVHLLAKAIELKLAFLIFGLYNAEFFASLNVDYSESLLSEPLEIAWVAKIGGRKQ